MWSIAYMSHLTTYFSGAVWLCLFKISLLTCTSGFLYFLLLVAYDMQALAAASKTVDCLKLVHSLHAYFLLVGDFDS